MNQTAENPAAVRRTRLSLLVLFAIFAAPVVVAWLVFYVFPDWRPSGTSNHGQLVTPARPLPEFRLDTLGGDPLERTFLRGKWTFVYLAQGPCDEACVQVLYKIRQVRLSQGKDIDRLQRLMLWDARGLDAAARGDLQAHFPGQRVALVDGGAAPLVDSFRIDARPPLQARRIYLVDPMGNLMMSYEADADPRGMMKDLHRLLKYSGLG
ncbi:MAG TPA: hypothetical protein ENK12_05365 [Gammaproteobacteria bacterium]|nr:hypothetical protein [Gammaproteobacteria bacterium]